MSRAIEPDYDTRHERLGLTDRQASGETCIVCCRANRPMVPAGWVVDNPACESQVFRCAEDCDLLHDPESHYPFALGATQHVLVALLDALDEVDAAKGKWLKDRIRERVASLRAQARETVAEVEAGAKIMRGGA